MLTHLDDLSPRTALAPLPPNAFLTVVRSPRQHNMAPSTFLPSSLSASSSSSSSTATRAVRWELNTNNIVRLTRGSALACLCLALLFLISARFLRSARKIYLAPRAVAHLQGPPIKHWLMGSYTKREISGGKFTHRVLDDIKRYGRVHGSVLLGRKPHIVVADARVATKVLLQTTYPKVPSSLAFMRRHVGRGLLGEEGEAHRRQRKIAGPAFTQAAVNAMHGSMKEKSLALVARLNRVMDAAESGQAGGNGVLINCSTHFNKMALDIIGSVGFGYEFNALYEDCRTPLDDAFADLMASMSTGTIYATLRGRLGRPVERFGRFFRVREQIKLDEAMRTVQKVSQVLVSRAKVQIAGEIAAEKKAKEEEEREVEGQRQQQQQQQQQSCGVDAEAERCGAELSQSSSSGSSALSHSSGLGGGAAGRRSSSANVSFGPRAHTDLLSLMVRANMAKDLKPSQRLSDAELRGMVPAMLSAGHETASTALSWACYALTRPGHGLEVQRRLRAELLENNHAWQADAASLHALPYLDAVVRETLRLHSPIRGLRRLVPHDDILPLASPIRLADGSETKEVLVKRGTVLFFSLIAINTDDAVWGDGSVFRPERWLDESHEFSDAEEEEGDDDDDDDDVSSSAAAAARCNAAGGGDAERRASRLEPGLKNVWSSLLSFGMGPTSCIGMRVALLEIKAGLAALLSNFEILPPELPDGPPVDVDYLIQIVAHPVVKGREKEGTQVPIRIRRLPGVQPVTPIPL